MRLTAWVCALLWGAPAYAASVLVVPDSDEARELAGELFEPLRSAQVTVKLAGAAAPAALCMKAPAKEKPSCLSEAGRGAGVEALLLVAASGRGGRANTTLTLIQTDGARSLRREAVKGPRERYGALAAPACKRLAAAIKAISPLERPAEPRAAAEPAKPAAQPQADRPLQPTLVPAPEVLDATLEPAPGRAGTGLRVAAWTATGLAVAAAGTAVAFGVLGLGPRSAVTGAADGTLTYGRAQELSARANTNFSVALGAGIGAAAFGGLAGVLWSQVK